MEQGTPGRRARQSNRTPIGNPDRQWRYPKEDGTGPESSVNVCIMLRNGTPLN